jgi:hypothetical protein
MPTKAGLYPLLMNIRAQAEPQVVELKKDKEAE